MLGRSLPSSRLMGRDREILFLTEHANAARKGRGGLVFLKGEAGVGKTSLLKELKNECDSTGTIFLQGKCYSPTIPYSPWVEAVSECAKKTDPQTLKALCKGPSAQIVALVPFLGDLLGEKGREVGLKSWLKGPKPTSDEKAISSPTGGTEDKTGRMAFLEGMTQFFTTLSTKHPLVISLEDLHQADNVSLILLRYMTRHIFANRILLVGSFREEELDPSHPLWRLVLELEKEGLCQTMRLETLPRDSVHEFVTNILGNGSMSQRVADVVYNATRGNPYFVSETLRSMEEQGIISQGFVDEAKLRQAELPSNVKALLRQRLERLDPECVELLTTGSLMGPIIDHELLSEVSALPEERMLTSLEAALRNGLLHEEKVGTSYSLQFNDPRIPSMLQQDLSIIRRRRMHERIGQAMEKHYSKNPTEFFAPIAYHFIEAGNVEKAVHYSMMAGEQATLTYAYDEAIKHYRNVTELKEHGDEAQEAENRIRILQRSIEGWNQALAKAALKLTVDKYTSLSERYEENYVPRFEPLARRIVANAGLKKGNRVLDVGTGTGLAAFLAAEVVGPTGHVMGIDLSEGMLSLARAKKQKRNIANVEFQKMDETSLDISDNSFDAVISNLGLSRLNPDKGFREMHRVLKPGGVLSVNEWTSTQAILGKVFGDLVGKYRTKSPSEVLVGMREARTSIVQFYDRVNDPALLQKMMRDAGFLDVRRSMTQQRVTFSTVDDYIKLAHSSPTISYELDEMTAEDGSEFMKELNAALKPMFSPSGLVSDWELNYITARK